MGVPHVPNWHGPYDAPNLSRDLLNTGRTTLDARILQGPPLEVTVDYTGTDPSVGDVLRGQSSDVVLHVQTVDTGADTLVALSYSGRLPTVAETLTNETAANTITADATALLGATTGNMIRPILGDPATGEVGFLSKWKSSQIARRKCELLANTQSGDFRQNGYEVAPTVTGGALAQRNSGPYVRLTTGTVVGNFATVHDTRNLFRWKWDPSIHVWLRVQTFTNARLWIAASTINLDAEDGTTLGAGDKVVAFKLDGVDDNFIHTVVWDGTTLTDVSALDSDGVDIQGASNTLYRFGMEVDTAKSEARFYLYNWQSGVNHGLVGTVPFVANATDLWGIEIICELLSGASPQTVDISKIVVEHDA